MQQKFIIGPVGRPKDTLDSLPLHWKESILFLYSGGYSDVEIKATIYSWRGSFSNRLWDRWMKEEEEFRETILMGRMLAEAFYMKEGRENMNNPKFNNQIWYLTMKNRFGWSEKAPEQPTADQDTLPEQEVEKQLHELLTKIAATQQSL
jgi:hypothetical protein